MKKITNKILGFARNYKYSIPVLVIIIIIGGVIAVKTKKPEVKNETITAARANVVQEVSVTGRVRPAKDVQLSIQSGGKVTSLSAVVGKQVMAGQTLLRVDTSDLQIRLGRQQATLAKVKLAYENQAPGASNASSDLTKAYENGFNAVSDAFLDLPSIMSGVDAILDQSYLSENNISSFYGSSARSFRDDTQRQFNSAEDRYQDVLAQYKNTTRESSTSQIDSLITNTYEVTKLIADSIKKTNNLVDLIKDEMDNDPTPEVTADLATLNGYTKDINEHVSSLLLVRDEIKNAREDISSETNNTSSSEIDIKQAELDIQDTLVQINNRTIKSPVSGTVTNVDIEVGESLSPGTPVISVISGSQFEIEANVPEADVSKLVVGREALVTLDAYGSDVEFKATVVSINPAETLIDGVATYKATFQFVEKDERIKSGMTSNIIVKGDQKTNVIAIPQRAIISKDNKKVVQVQQADNTIIEKTVETGLRGSDGNIEITSGIVEGEKVVVFTEAK